MASRSGGQATCSTRPEPAAATTASAIAPQREVLVVPDVEDLARRVGRERGEQQALDDVVDVEAVALLRSRRRTR